MQVGDRRDRRDTEDRTVVLSSAYGSRPLRFSHHRVCLSESCISDIYNSHQ